VNLLHTAPAESDSRPRSTWPLAAVAAGLLVTAAALYVVAWGQDASWPWIFTIALFHLVPVTSAAFFLRRSRGLTVAGIAILTLVPLVWRGWQLDRALVSFAGLGALALVLLSWAGLLGSLVDTRRHQAAVHDTRLYESASLRVRQLATLNDIGRAVISSLDLSVKASSLSS
jgi:hypothetical protein